MKHDEDSEVNSGSTLRWLSRSPAIVKIIWTSNTGLPLVKAERSGGVVLILELHWIPAEPCKIGSEGGRVLGME
jgi:hypothetical protein